jgi:hypothetical protein
MMNKRVFCIIIILFGLALVFSCNQDPIFFTISTEPIPVKPRIPGSPTKIVEFSRDYSVAGTSTIESVPIMYVASGNLHWYARAEKGTGASGWDSAEYDIPQPGGKVIGLAATDKHLYALCIIDAGVSTVLRRIGSSENEWKDIEIAESKYTLIQSIYATKGTTGRLFAGARDNNGSDFGVLYLDDTSTPTLRLLISDSGMLSGAASDSGGTHYLITRGKGVYQVTGSSYVQLGEDGNPDGEKNRLFMGMIQLDNTAKSIIVVERNGGTFYEVKAAGFKPIKYSDNDETMTTGRYATGALALWQQVLYNDGLADYTTGKRTLVAGIQGDLYSGTISSSSYTYGYVEFDLDNGGSLVLDSHRDTTPNWTVDGNTDRYTATIGKHPVNHIHQATKEVDADKTFFASTQTAGFWSYRNRTGGPQWNAEN